MGAARWSLGQAKSASIKARAPATLLLRCLISSPPARQMSIGRPSVSAVSSRSRLVLPPPLVSRQTAPSTSSGDSWAAHLYNPTKSQLTEATYPRKVPLVRRRRAVVFVQATATVTTWRASAGSAGIRGALVSSEEAQGASKRQGSWSGESRGSRNSKRKRPSQGRLQKGRFAASSDSLPPGLYRFLHSLTRTLQASPPRSKRCYSLAADG